MLLLRAETTPGTLVLPRRCKVTYGTERRAEEEVEGNSGAAEMRREDGNLALWLPDSHVDGGDMSCAAGWRRGRREWGG